MVECATFDTTSPRTPAAPYTNASFWMGFFDSDNPKSVGQGQLFDFIPVTSGGQGIPAVADYPADEGGPLIEEGNYIVCDCHSGPASQRLTVSYQGYAVAV